MNVQPPRGRSLTSLPHTKTQATYRRLRQQRNPGNGGGERLYRRGDSAGTWSAVGDPRTAAQRE
jgi:hypothetical protein